MTRILLALLLAGAASAAEIRNPGTFVFAIGGDADTLDPHWQFDTTSSGILYQVYEPLVFFKGESTTEFEPVLAEKVPAPQNGRIYRFPIRKGVRFHDGSVLTPEDVRYSLLRFMLLDRPGGASARLLKPVLGVETTGPASDPSLFMKAAERVRVDGGSVVVTLEKPDRLFLTQLANFGLIVSKRWMIAQGAWDGTLEGWAAHHRTPKESEVHEKANGTGPFRVERWDRTGRQIVLARFDGWHGGRAKLERVLFKTVPDANTRRLMLAAGDADAIAADRQQAPQLAGLEGVVVRDGLPVVRTNTFAFDLAIDTTANPYVGSGRLDGAGIPPDFFADLDVREGLAYAFDHDAFLKDVYRGQGERPLGPIPRASFGFDAAQPHRDFDPAKAAERLKKARGGEVWSKGFRFAVLVAEGKGDRLVAAQILKKNVEALNPKFRVDVQELQWSTYLGAWSSRKFPLVATSWLHGHADPLGPATAFLGSQGSCAKTQGYRNARADALIAEAETPVPERRLKQIYKELQAIAYADVPQIYYPYTWQFQPLRTWVKGWAYNPTLAFGLLAGVEKSPG